MSTLQHAGDAWFGNSNFVANPVLYVGLPLPLPLLAGAFFEEFLFRGALQPRLRGLLGPSAALVLQALIFGVWHLGLGFTDTGHAGILPSLMPRYTGPCARRGTCPTIDSIGDASFDCWGRASR